MAVYSFFLLITAMISEVMNYATTRAVVLYFLGAADGIYGAFGTTVALAAALADLAAILIARMGVEKIGESIQEGDAATTAVYVASMLGTVGTTIFNAWASYFAFYQRGETHPADIKAALGAHAPSQMALALAVGVLLLRIFVLHMLFDSNSISVDFSGLTRRQKGSLRSPRRPVFGKRQRDKGSRQPQPRKPQPRRESPSSHWRPPSPRGESSKPTSGQQKSSLPQPPSSPRRPAHRPDLSPSDRPPTSQQQRKESAQSGVQPGLLPGVPSTRPNPPEEPEPFRDADFLDDLL